MNIKLSLKSKSIPYLLIIFVSCLLGMNTNNNPNSFIERLFKPISTRSTTFNYGGFILIFLILFSLKKIYDENHYKFLNTDFKRIIIMVFIIIMSSKALDGGVKIYKSFSSDLNAIYSYKDNMDLIITPIEENKVKLICFLELENCSSTTKEFYVKLSIPEYAKDKIHELTLDKENLEGLKEPIVLKGKEKRNLEIIFIANKKSNEKNVEAAYKNLEFYLYNNDEEVKFNKKLGYY